MGYIFKPKLQRFKQIHVFKEYSNGFSSHSVIYIKSQNRLLLFGGSANEPMLDTIYSFCLYNFKWIKLKITLPVKLKNASFIMSGNEKFILMFGGSVEGMQGTRQNKKIYVMDVQTFSFWKINLMLFSLCKGEMIGAVLMNNTKFNGLIIYSYLHSIWMTLERNNKRFVSDDCIQIILSYYGDGDIYILNKKGCHRKVRIDDILSKRIPVNLF